MFLLFLDIFIYSFVIFCFNEKNVVIVTLFLLLGVGIVSAGFFDSFYGFVFGDITGKDVGVACVDYDSMNYSTASYATGLYGSSQGSASYSDYCVKDKGGSGESIVEYYCSPQGKVAQSVQECPSTCVNGACVIGGKVCSQPPCYSHKDCGEGYACFGLEDCGTGYGLACSDPSMSIKAGTCQSSKSYTTCDDDSDLCNLTHFYCGYKFTPAYKSVEKVCKPRASLGSLCGYSIMGKVLNKTYDIISDNVKCDLGLQCSQLNATGTGVCVSPEICKVTYSLDTSLDVLPPGADYVPPADNGQGYQPGSCVDSDSTVSSSDNVLGNEKMKQSLTKPGTCTSGGQTYKDSCSGWHMLSEYYCSAGTVSCWCRRRCVRPF